MEDKTKHEINLENWEFIENLTREEYLKDGMKKTYRPSYRGKYKCKHCGVIKHIDNSHFKDRLTKCDCFKNEEVNNATGAWRSNLERWEFIGYPSDLGTPKHKGNLYHCKTCGAEKFMTISNFKRKETVCDEGCHGIGKNKSFIIKGVNDLATTHPHLVKYLVNEEDGFRLKGRSNVSINVKCPLCGAEKEQTVSNLTARGFSCPACADGVSYPEKFVGALLSELRLNYKTQVSTKTFEWCNNKRYDFYIPSLNMIIETHGRQHYEEIASFGERSLQEEQENDRYKRELALENGIDTYIELDCSFSDFGYLKESVNNSKLGRIINLDSVDWEELKKTIIKNDSLVIVQSYCEFYNENRDSMRFNDMAKELGVSPSCFRRNLLKGVELGLTDYRATHLRRIRATNKITGKSIEFEGIVIASKELNIQRQSISSVLCGRNKSSHGYFFNYC